MTGGLLMWSDLTLGLSFKVKPGYPNLKVLMICLILILEVCKAIIYLGPLLQGQTMVAKHKSAYDSCIIGPRGLEC